MRNILSYQLGTKFTGLEIIQWAKFQVAQKTSHMRQGACILHRFGNVKPERLYTVSTSYSGTGCGEVLEKPLVQRISM